MTKTKGIEVLRETIRRARIARDNGDTSAHDRVMYLTNLLKQLQPMKSLEAKSYMEKYNIRE